MLTAAGIPAILAGKKFGNQCNCLHRAATPICNRFLAAWRNASQCTPPRNPNTGCDQGGGRLSRLDASAW